LLFLLLFSTPSITHPYTLSLHDALPISFVRDSPVSHSTHHAHSREHRAKYRLSGDPIRATPAVIRRHHLSASRTGYRYLARCSRSEEHTSELQSPYDLVCRLLLEKKKRQ